MMEVHDGIYLFCFYASLSLFLSPSREHRHVYICMDLYACRYSISIYICEYTYTDIMNIYVSVCE